MIGRSGHPVVFPATLLVGNAGDEACHMRYQFRVPMDDTHTLHLWYHVIVPPGDLAIPADLAGTVHTYDVPYQDERGQYLLDSIHAQDIMAWITQGPIADRSLEALGTTDRGVTVYRNMLRRELKRVENGEDPMNVFRGAEPETMQLPLELERTQGDLSPRARAAKASPSPICGRCSAGTKALLPARARDRRHVRETSGAPAGRPCPNAAGLVTTLG